MDGALANLPTPWAADIQADWTATADTEAGCSAPCSATGANSLLARARTLSNVRLGGLGIRKFAGVPLRLYGAAPGVSGFVHGHIFALIASDGSICMRPPRRVAEDLIENGLCSRLRRNVLTWPASTPYRLEVNWRLLLQMYSHLRGTPPGQSRTMWSEWATNSLRKSSNLKMYYGEQNA